MKKAVLYLILCMLVLSGCGNSEGSTPTNIRDSSGATSSISSKVQMTTIKSTTVTTKKHPTTKLQSFDNADKTSAKVTETTKKTKKIVQTAIKRTTTTTEDNTWEYLQAIQEENDRYDEAIQEIDRIYENEIESEKDFAEEYERSIRENHGYRVYENLNTLNQKIEQLQNKIALLSRDTSGIYAYDLRKAQEELGELFEKRMNIELWKSVDEQWEATEGEINRLNNERNREKEEEQQKHETNISKINMKYSR